MPGARHGRRFRYGLGRPWLLRSAAGFVVLAGGVAALVAWGSAPVTHRVHISSPSTTTTSTTSTTTTPTTTIPTPSRVGTYQVASTSLHFVEPPTGAGAARSLPTTVWYPVAGAGPARGAPFPLLVFSQGYDASVTTYRSLIDDWASAGFVVAAPTYPRTDPSDPAGVDESDIVNHPADLRFVITSVLAQSAQAGTALSGLIDPSAIGVVGQSDGADVTLAVAADSCCQDPRVKAAAVLSGAELAAFGGRYYTGTVVPVLVVQGSADTINPPACSTQLYDGAPAPRFALDLIGAGHLPPYADAGTDQDVVVRVTTDFFDAELARQPAGLPAMTGDGSVAGVTSLSSGASAPWPSGSCPGAPG